MADRPDIAWTVGWGVTEPSGGDRREAERVVAYWEEKLQALGGDFTIAALDLAAIDNKDWSSRFLVAVDPVIERSQLILYGPEFARHLGLPAQPRTDRPLNRQLPPRYVEIFLAACAEATKHMAPVRREGELERADGRVEQYRAAFIPVRIKPNSLTALAFGAFSNRILDGP